MIIATREMDRKMLRYPVIALLLLGLVATAPPPAAAQISIVRSVIGNGPTLSTDGTTVVAATVGQTSVGLTRQDLLGVYQGFWGATLLTLSVDGPQEGVVVDGLGLSHPYPNPVVERASVSMTLERRTSVRATLVDGLGRELRIILEETRSPGEHLIGFGVGDLASGLYHLRVVAGEVVRTVPVVVAE